MNDINRRRILAGICLTLLAVLFLTNPLTGIMFRSTMKTPTAIAVAGFLAPVQMALFVGAAIGISQLLRKKADRIGLAGAIIATIGFAVGVRIMVLSQLDALLRGGVTGVPANTLDKIFEAEPLIWVSIVPTGILFPLGLIILGVTIFVTQPVNRWIGALLVAGAIMFPVGRAIGVPWAFSLCDVLLGAAFALIGWQVLTRRELWPA